MRHLIVGDVHGCFEELMLLLEKTGYNPSLHKLILLGDLINKGPDSFKVLSWVRAQQKIHCSLRKRNKRPFRRESQLYGKNKHNIASTDRKTAPVSHVEALIGNHELKFMVALENQHTLSGALEKLRQDMGEKWREWLSWMKNWPIYIEEEDFLAVHGGIVPGEHPSQSKKEYLVNIRYWDGEGKDMNNPTYPPWHECYTGSKLVVYAHWAQQGLKVKKNSIGLDTGCVYGGKLSGLWLPDRKLTQVSSLNPVCPPRGQGLRRDS